MILRLLAIVGVLLALFGLIVAPRIVTRGSRRLRHAIHQLHPDEDDVPWDLSGWIPVGFIDGMGPYARREWKWMPELKRVK